MNDRSKPSGQPATGSPSPLRNPDGPQALALGGPLCSIPGASRREFIASISAASLAAAMEIEAASGAELGPSRVGPLIDVNVNLDRWPLRRLPEDDPRELVRKLRSRGVRQAWVGSLDALLHRDRGALNARLAAACRAQGRGMLRPFGSINPLEPDWEEELRRCLELHRMSGVRLHPNYHGYKLDHPEFIRLVRAAAQGRCIVQIALVMEDERMMHPALRVEPVDTEPLAALVSKTPGLRLVLLNALRTLRGPGLQRLIQSGDVSVEISMLEGVGGVGRLLEQVPPSHVLFGSHAPLFYFEAAELKLLESPLTPEQLRSIAFENAARLLRGTASARTGRS